MPPLISPHLDILFSFGPLNIKHTDKKSTRPQDAKGLEISAWGVAGEAGSAQGRDNHRENPITCLSVCMRGSPRAKGFFSSAWQAQHKLWIMFQPSTEETISHKTVVTQPGQSCCAFSLLGKFQNSSGQSTEQLGPKPRASIVWGSFSPWATLWSPSVLSGLWKAEEGSAPVWDHLQHCLEFGYSITFWNTSIPS